MFKLIVPVLQRKELKLREVKSRFPNCTANNAKGRGEDQVVWQQSRAPDSGAGGAILAMLPTSSVTVLTVSCSMTVLVKTQRNHPWKGLCRVEPCRQQHSKEDGGAATGQQPVALQIGGAFVSESGLSVGRRAGLGGGFG